VRSFITCYVSPIIIIIIIIIIRVIKLGRTRGTGHVSCMGETRHAYKILVRKPERKRPLRRFESRWEEIIKDLREIGWELGGWIHNAYDRVQWRALVKTVMNLRVP